METGSLVIINVSRNVMGCSNFIFPMATTSISQANIASDNALKDITAPIIL